MLFLVSMPLLVWIELLETVQVSPLGCWVHWSKVVVSPTALLASLLALLGVGEGTLVLRVLGVVPLMMDSLP